MPDVKASHIDGWLTELGLVAVERAERDGITSWDLVLDGRRRADIRLTLILDPRSLLLLWVHYAPPLNDSFRVSYRRFLRWNDELPHVKFALSGNDDRPVLTSELPVAGLDADVLGIGVARLLTVCDLLLDESVRWLWPGAKGPPPLGRASRQGALLERYAAELAELATPDAETETAEEAEDDGEASADGLPEDPSRSVHSPA